MTYFTVLHSITKNGRKYIFCTIYPYGSKKKSFLCLVLGITGTAFGMTNIIQITRINAIIAKNIHRTDMMVDVQQLHENHLYKLDNQIKNTGLILHEFQQYTPSKASSYLDNRIASIFNVLTFKETSLELAQNQKISHTLFPNDV